MATARKARGHSTRYWYTATYRAHDGQHGVLEPHRGGRVVVVDLETLEEKTNARDSTLVLRAREGDHLILCGPGIEENASAVVVHVEPRGWTDRIHVQLHCGVVRDGEIAVIKAGRAA